MSQMRDYVTSVELMITTGLDRATIDHVLSYLTKFEKLMSMRPDVWIERYDMDTSKPFMTRSKSPSYVDRFYFVNRHRYTKDEMKRYMHEIVSYDLCNLHDYVYGHKVNSFTKHVFSNKHLFSDYTKSFLIYNVVKCFDYDADLCLIELMKTRSTYDIVAKHMSELLPLCIGRNSLRCLIYLLESVGQTDNEFDQMKNGLCDSYNRLGLLSDECCEDWVVCILLLSVIYRAEECTDYIIREYYHLITPDGYYELIDELQTDLPMSSVVAKSLLRTLDRCDVDTPVFNELTHFITHIVCSLDKIDCELCTSWNDTA